MRVSVCACVCVCVCVRVCVRFVVFAEGVSVLSSPFLFSSLLSSCLFPCRIYLVVAECRCQIDS